jgi:DNA-binding MarR family transcriptional regulator
MGKVVLEAVVEDLLAAMPIFHRKLTGFLQQGTIPGVSHYHFMILNILSQSDALAMSEISRRLSVSKPQLTAMVEKLFRMGLVNRVQGERDRRILQVSITEKGKIVVDQTKELVARSLAQKLSLLGEDDLKSFSTAIKNIVIIGSKLE